MASEHSYSWYTPIISLNTREAENQNIEYLTQPGLHWYPQQASVANASLHGLLSPAPVFETPRSPHSSESGESSTCSTAGTSNSQSRKRTPWTKVEEEILIDLCREHKSTLKGSGSSGTWQEIADQLSRSSDEINTSSSIKTGTQCKDKWHNLLNAYKKAKDSSTKTGGGTKTIKAFRHFEQMDMFMGDKHEITMPFVRNSSKSISVESKDGSAAPHVNTAVGNEVSSPASDLYGPSTSGVQLEEVDGPPQRPQRRVS